MNRRSRKQNRFAAIVAAALLVAVGALSAMLVVKSLYPVSYKETVESCCEEFGVEPTLVYAVIHTESGFDAEARSEAGALGLMQIMPDTFAWLQGRLNEGEHMNVERLFEPEVNIRYGVYFLSLLDAMFGDDVLTVAAYHAGQSRVSEWLGQERIPAAGCRAEDIPSDTTGHYVRKVERTRSIYKRLYRS